MPARRRSRCNRAQRFFIRPAVLRSFGVVNLMWPFWGAFRWFRTATLQICRLGKEAPQPPAAPLTLCTAQSASVQIRMAMVNYGIETGDDVNEAKYQDGYVRS